MSREIDGVRRGQFYRENLRRLLDKFGGGFRRLDGRLPIPGARSVLVKTGIHLPAQHLAHHFGACVFAARDKRFLKLLHRQADFHPARFRPGHDGPRPGVEAPGRHTAGQGERRAGCNLPDDAWRGERSRLDREPNRHETGQPNRTENDGRSPSCASARPCMRTSSTNQPPTLTIQNSIRSGQRLGNAATALAVSHTATTGRTKSATAANGWITSSCAALTSRPDRPPRISQRVMTRNTVFISSPRSEAIYAPLLRSTASPVTPENRSSRHRATPPAHHPNRAKCVPRAASIGCSPVPKLRRLRENSRQNEAARYGVRRFIAALE